MFLARIEPASSGWRPNMIATTLKEQSNNFIGYKVMFFVGIEPTLKAWEADVIATTLKERK